MTHQIDPAKLAKAREDQTKDNSILGEVFDGEQKEKPCTGESEGVERRLIEIDMKLDLIVSLLLIDVLPKKFWGDVFKN